MKLLVVAAINCGDRIEFLRQMQNLPESTQEVLMTTAQEAGEGDQGEEAEIEEIEDIPTTVDSALASEERLGKVLADNQRIAHEKRDLERQLQEAQTRQSKLQDRFDQSQDELKEANDRLTAVLAGEGGQNRPLDSKSESIIAALEARVTSVDSENEDLRRTNEVLKIKAEKSQKLQDDYDEIKIERDRLSRKANTAEKYKQKLEASQSLEKDNQTLRNKVNELQMQLKQSDSSRMSSSDLQREIEEYRRLLPSIEQERYELNEMKKRLEFDYHTLQARYNDTVEELNKQHNTVEELQGRLRDYEDGITPATPRDDEIKDLETEEAEFAESEAKLTAALMDGDSQIDGISEDELKAIMSAMRAQAQAGSATEKESSMKAQKKLVIAVEKARSKNKQLLEHIQKQSDLISNLQSVTKQPETVPKVSTPVVTPVAEVQSHSFETPQAGQKLEDTLQLNENLRRELKLVTSAWYEQNIRLASSGALPLRTRGQPEPRSFLGKQRRAVETVVLGSRMR